MKKLFDFILKSMILYLIKIYQIGISPFLLQRCRFLPTCSQYSKEAITKHGVIKGGILSIRRILRCNPFGDSGIDEVDQ